MRDGFPFFPMQYFFCFPRVNNKPQGMTIAYVIPKSVILQHEPEFLPKQ
jgi:hypothetical protein